MRRKAVDTRQNNRIGTKRLYKRAFGCFGAIILVTGILMGRVIYLNLEKGTEYKKRVLAQESYVGKEINYKRGDIVDRNGNKLAVSRKVYDLILDPNMLSLNREYRTHTSKALKEVFGITQDALDEILEGRTEQKYYLMQDYKGLSKEDVQEFQKKEEKDEKIKGVSFEERYERYYPYSSVASKVIGFCSTDNNGVWGLENQYNGELSGVNGRKYGYFNADLELVENVKEPTDGNTIVSTIDVNVQGILERHMKEFQEETGSKNMGCIIMNPQNGEIYAMTSYPEYDLNHPRDLSPLYSEKQIKKMTEKKVSEALNRMWRNFCVSDAYEPGSTFKPVTIAAGMDEGVTNANRHYNCNGYQMVGGRKIKCVAYSNGGHGSEDLCHALMDSCNDVLMQISEDLGRDKFLKYVDDFGFGKKTGIDLPGEAVGGVFTRDTMHSVELATSSFGQSQTVTMIQLAAAFSAVINGGNYYEPHVMKEVHSPSGAVTRSNNNTLIRRIITESTSKKLRNYLIKTVEEGTASPAKVAGYKIGGKTGTAEKYPRGKGNYLVSFAGFVMEENPEVVIYTVVDEPNVKDQAHSIFATEFSSEVLKEVLPLLSMYQDEDVKKEDKTLATDIKIPSNLVEVPKGGFVDGDYGALDGDFDETEDKETEKEEQ